MSNIKTINDQMESDDLKNVSVLGYYKAQWGHWLTGAPDNVSTHQENTPHYEKSLKDTLHQSTFSVVNFFA